MVLARARGTHRVGFPGCSVGGKLHCRPEVQKLCLGSVWQMPDHARPVKAPSPFKGRRSRAALSATAAWGAMRRTYPHERKGNAVGSRRHLGQGRRERPARNIQQAARSQCLSRRSLRVR